MAEIISEARYPYLVHLEPGESRYPAARLGCRGVEASEGLVCWGNLAILGQPVLAMFCSSKCPGNLILEAYGFCLALRKAGTPLAGGFYSPVEKEALYLALRGEQAVLLSPARGLEGMRLPVEHRIAITDGQLLLASIFSGKVKRLTVQAAMERNRFVAALAEKVVVIHAEPQGRLFALCQEILAWGKPLYTLESEHNRALIELGAQVVG